MGSSLRSSETCYSVFVLEGVSFLHSSLYGTVFGFVLGTVLLVQGCFISRWAALTQPQGLFCVSGLHTSAWAGVHEKLGGDMAGTTDPDWPEGCSTPVDVVLSNKSQGKERGQGNDQSYYICHCKYALCLMKPYFHSRQSICLPMGGGGQIPYFSSLLCAALLCLLNHLYLKW